MNENKHHVQLPNNMCLSGELSPKDLLVYVSIKSFLNKNSKECFPSLDTIVERSGVSKPTVRKSIEILKKENYISVKIKGRSNYYSFNSYKTFEPFSYDFIKDKNLDANLKAYIITTQQLMFKDAEGYGKISYSDSELASLINIDKRTITKYNKSLEEKGYLSIVPTNKKDDISGVKINEKIFHLDKLGQAIIWTLKKHEDDINELKERTDSTNKTIDLVLESIEQLKEAQKISETKDKIKTEALYQAGVDMDKINTMIDIALNGEIKM